MPGIGVNQLTSTGRQMIRLLASNDGDWLPIGATIDWTTVAVQNTATVTSVAENAPVPAGGQFLRYGQFMTRITTKPAQVLTQTGASTLSGYNPLQGTTNSAALAGSANLAAVQAAMDAIYGAGNTLVTGSGPFTVTFIGALAGYPIPTITATAGVTVAVTTGGGNYGSFGPYDPAATDGRATISAGNCGFVDKSVIKNGVLGFLTSDTDHMGLLIGGTVWKTRLIVTSGTHTLAAGPTFAELAAALPAIKFAGGF